MKTSLIIVEGIPGSGKSTTASNIAGLLKEKGKTVVCLDEDAADHPADYADYNFPDFKTEKSAIYEKWLSFAEHASKDMVYVFNCIFLQNPMSETMMRFGMDESTSLQYISGIARIIEPMNPFIVYLNPADVSLTIERVLNERGSGWLNSVIEYHTLQGYGKEHHLEGYEGYLECLKERKNRECRILPKTGLKHCILDHDLKPEELLELIESID